MTRKNVIKSGKSGVLNVALRAKFSRVCVL